MAILVPPDLVEAAMRGADDEIEHLLVVAWPQAYKLARAIVTDSRVAEDVAQDACVAVLRNISALRDSAAFASWFYRIIVREAIKQKKPPLASPTRTDARYDPDLSASIDLWRALDQLSAEHRAVVVLHYFEGLRSREIADVLRIPGATVRFRLMRARHRLKHLLTTPQATNHEKGEELYAL